jgi:DNA polymerase
MEIYRYLMRFPGLSQAEWGNWVLDQVINATGITIDLELIKAALEAKGFTMSSLTLPV